MSVAASDMSTKFNSTKMMAKDGFYTFSNLGSCVDIFAPGAFRIRSASLVLSWFCLPAPTSNIDRCIREETCRLDMSMLREC